MNVQTHFVHTPWKLLMELQVTSLLHSSKLIRNSNTFPLHSCLLNPTYFPTVSNILKKNNHRHDLSTMSSALQSSSMEKDSFKLTYLELNSWLWDVGGVIILVDPILVGNLDFGIPWLFELSKKSLKAFKLSDLPEVDCLLITQAFDDHCHMKTLNPLSKMLPNLRVIASLNAESLLSPLFKNVTYLKPGQSSEIKGKIGSKVRVKAIAGPRGPPWLRPESGYIVTAQKGKLSLYYEPHCVYDSEIVKKEKANIIITPVMKRLLLPSNMPLVFGQEDAVRLAKLLKAKIVVPMEGGELNTNGLLSGIIQSEGTVERFKALLSKEIKDAQVLEPTPRVPLEIFET